MAEVSIKEFKFLDELGFDLIELHRWKACRVYSYTREDYKLNFVPEDREASTDEEVFYSLRRSDMLCQPRISRPTVRRSGKFLVKNPEEPLGKTPARKHWTTLPTDNRRSIRKAHVDKINLGVRLRASDLVIDVDPRNFPDGETLKTANNPLKRICQEFGLRLKELPVVKTGSGGYHVYLRKPSGISIKKSLVPSGQGSGIWRKSHKYDGLDFLSVGRFVVAPGAVHPCGKSYRWVTDPDNLWLNRPDAPEKLLDELKKPEYAAEKICGEGDLSSEDMAQVLAKLPVEEFQDHETWFSFMCSVHHVSGGSAVDEFVDWSVGDGMYSDHGDLIRHRWSTLGDYDGPRAGIGTFVHHLKQHGLSYMVDLRPDMSHWIDDFAEEV